MQNEKSKKINKKLVLVSLLCLFIISVLVIQYKRQQTIVLEFGMFTGSNWNVANANSFIIIDEAIERFEKEHPGVKIHYYSGIRKDDYSEWLSRKLLSGEEPDVFMVLGNDFNQFASMGVLKDLQGNISHDKDFDADRYFTSAFQTGQYGERQYALPYETVPTLMFVNKSLLTKQGIEMPSSDWTWHDLYSICVRVTKDTDGDGIKDKFGTCNYGWMDAVCCSGASLFKDEGKECSFADEGVSDAVKFVKQINNLYGNQKVTQGASVLKDVTGSEEMENIVLQNMAVGDTIINRELLSQVIEEGYVEPQFKKYDQAMSLADGEINQILDNDKTIDSSLKLLQRSINEFLSQ